MNVVVFKFNHLGDNVVFVPALQALRRQCPDWRITLLTTPKVAELYGGPLGPQEVLVWPKRRFDRSPRRPWELAWWAWAIRRRRPDACLVSFDQGYAAHAVARLSGARVRIGGEPARLARALTQGIPMPEDQRPVTWNWRMARALARGFGRDQGWPDLPPPPDLRHLLASGARPPGARRRVVVHAGANRSLNQWPAEQFSAVARALARDFEVVWIAHDGTTGQAPPGTVGAPVASLGELAQWAASADLFLGNNSGPMHLANALGAPGVAVTGPSAPGWDPFWGRERWTVLRHPNLRCAPCEVVNRELHGCANTADPMACLRYWTADRVEADCRSRLAEPGGPAR